MAKKLKNPAQPKQLPIDEFMAKHQNELEESEESILLKHLAQQDRKENWGHSALGGMEALYSAAAAAEVAHSGWKRKSELMSELRKYWLVRLLRAAKKENSPDAFRDLLEGWLIRLGVEAPEGVFVPLRGSPGRPRSRSTGEIYECWTAQTDRKDFNHLAFTVFGRDYISGDPNLRKNMRERCRQAVKRHQETLAT